MITTPTRAKASAISWLFLSLIFQFPSMPFQALSKGAVLTQYKIMGSAGDKHLLWWDYFSQLPQSTSCEKLV